MPRNVDDENEKSAKRLVDTMVNYSLVAEDCLAHLRTFNETTVKDLWVKSDEIFMRDSAQYPSAIPPRTDPAARERFRLKCMAFCFPPPSNLAVGPKDYIIRYFSAVAGMQYTLHHDMREHPYGLRLGRIANEQVCQRLGIQRNSDSTQQFDYTEANPDPAKLVDTKISCRDESSGQIVDYIVVDYMKSAVGGGDYFVVENKQGKRKTVTAEELSEIRV